MQAELIIGRRFFSRQRETAAWFLPGHDTAALLDGLARCGLEPLPRVYRTAEGFLVRPDVASPWDFPGGMRLGEVAQGIFAPLDAELAPALLPDEAAGITGGG